MKVNPTQIQELYTFTRDHFVEHYDLQTELVDHLSNGIEAQWKENPQLNFKEALNREFKKFGVFGFQDVISERVKAMEKRYLAYIWRFFKDYFTFPKVALTVFLIAVCYTLLRLLPAEIGIGVVYGVYFMSLLFMFYKTFKFRKQQRSKERRWIMEDLIFQHLGYLNVGFMPIYLFSWNINSENLQSEWWLILISNGLPCICLFLHIVTNIIPQKAEELLEETYPEYRIA
ncbi:hypothetical protein [Arenibacter latericius]|uniref:hypothetical protein n=1 Tax=Arenibacter latericius TaxID=86104 RepID=UPI0003F771BF|nr:hypothetical protein [Arenibacter latericius]